MTVLYLDRKTMRISREGQAIVLRDGDKRLTSVPLRLLERVVMYRNVQMDIFIFHHLANAGIPTIILGRGPGRMALVHGPWGKDAFRRIRQYQLYGDPQWRQSWSWVLVRHKLAAQMRLLRRMLGERRDLNHVLTTSLQRVSAAHAGLKEQPRQSLDSLRGVEGAAASASFHAYTRIFAPSLEFTGRNRRPPKDPVNAALSLGYTMLHAEVAIACYQHGFDPYIGFYHELAHGRESLAADLMDPLRPVVDGWIWDLFRKQELRARNFYREGEGCWLDKAGRAIFYKSWEEQARPLRRRIRRVFNLVLKNMQEYPLAAEKEHADNLS